MGYIMNEADIKKIADGLYQNYQSEWEKGIKDLFSPLINYGIIGTQLVKGMDFAKDTYSSLKNTTTQAFWTTFKPRLKSELKVYFGNRWDNFSMIEPLIKKALDQAISAIPVPGLDKVVGLISNVVVKKADAYVGKKAFQTADKQVLQGADAVPMFTNYQQAEEALKKSVDNYKSLGKLLDNIPKKPMNFDDIVVLPTMVWKLQKEASRQAVLLNQISQYLNGMSSRVDVVHGQLVEFLTSLRNELPKMVKNVIQHTYEGGKDLGRKEISTGKYTPAQNKAFVRPGGEDAVVLLAAYTAHASATGYFEVYQVSGPYNVKTTADLGAMHTQPIKNPMISHAPPVPPRPSRPFPPPKR